jgi:hypothetical protein
MLLGGPLQPIQATLMGRKEDMSRQVNTKMQH